MGWCILKKVNKFNRKFVINLIKSELQFTKWNDLLCVLYLINFNELHGHDNVGYVTILSIGSPTIDFILNYHVDFIIKILYYKSEYMENLKKKKCQFRMAGWSCLFWCYEECWLLDVRVRTLEVPSGIIVPCYELTSSIMDCWVSAKNTTEE